MIDFSKKISHFLGFERKAFSTEYLGKQQLRLKQTADVFYAACILLRPTWGFGQTRTFFERTYVMKLF